MVGSLRVQVGFMGSPKDDRVWLRETVCELSVRGLPTPSEDSGRVCTSPRVQGLRTMQLLQWHNGAFRFHKVLSTYTGENLPAPEYEFLL